MSPWTARKSKISCKSQLIGKDLNLVYFGNKSYKENNQIKSSIIAKIQANFITLIHSNIYMEHVQGMRQAGSRGK